MNSTSGPDDPIQYPSPEYAQWARSMVSSGKAASRDAQGRLPPGATHSIDRYDKDGVPILKRVRFA